MKSYWRHTSKKIIEQVMFENRAADEKELRKKISDACPFGQRSMHPYKIWLSEVKAQLRIRGLGKANKTKDQKTLFE
jgi:hypothetical protein